MNEWLPKFSILFGAIKEIIIYDVIHSNIIIESFKKVNNVYYFTKLYYYIYNFKYDTIKNNKLFLC